MPASDMENNPDKEFQHCITANLNIKKNSSKLRTDFKDYIYKAISRLRVIYNGLVNKIVIKDEIHY